ncbi:hypothetical protein [Petrimonas sp.]|uniref:hypothetical protein n=1 Tax=Petrimonas sp. TaxID=2023866 RepID=UPI002FCA9595
MKRLTHDIKFPTGKNKYFVWIFAICIYCLAMPYYMWQLNYKPFLIICALLLTIYFEKINILDKVFFGFSMILLYLYIGIISNWSLWGIIYLLLIIPIFFAKNKFIKQSFDLYIFIFSIMLVPSILQFIFVSILGVDMPHSTIKSLNAEKIGIYSRYLFMVSYSGGEIQLNSILPRFYSYFDEPGVVGTISAVMLSVKKFNLKSWINIPIFVAGILSFSLFFYLTTLIYLFILVKMKYKLVIIPALALLFILFSESELLKFHLIDRLDFNSNFVESFINFRNESGFQDWYSNFNKTPQYFTGMGAGYSSIVNMGGSSYKNIITDFGIIFFVTYVVVFALYAIRTLGYSKELLITLLVLFGIMYQRPFIQDLSYVFLIYAPIAFFKEETGMSIKRSKDERERRI